jgi:hypothetical protein
VSGVVGGQDRDAGRGRPSPYRHLGLVTIVGGVAAIAAGLLRNARDDSPWWVDDSWGAVPPGARLLLAGLGAVAIGLALRAEAVHPPGRDAVGRVLHVAVVVWILVTFDEVARVGAQFSAPPEAGVERVGPAALDRALLLFAVPTGVLGLLATWVSGFVPFIGVSVHKST